jgi:hypothetical protein
LCSETRPNAKPYSLAETVKKIRPMDINLIIQGAITLASSGGILLILREQIKAQNQQIANLKTYIDLIDIDELKKYTSVMKERAEADGQLKAEKVIKETFESEEFKEKLFAPIRKELNSWFERDSFIRGQELFNNTMDHLLLLPKQEAIDYIKEKYPINGEAMLQELQEAEKNDPDLLKEERQSFLKSLPDHLKSDEERNQTL